jgi:transposase
MWMPTGRTARRIFTKNLRSSKDERIVVFGAANLETGTVHRWLAPALNQVTFLHFLARMVKYYTQNHPNRPIYMVLDGNPVHRARRVRSWVEAQPQLQVYWLPKNSPELSPIEYFWKKLRKEVTHVCYYQTLPALKAALKRFFDRWGSKWRRLKEWFAALVQKLWTQDNLLIQVGGL